MIDKIKEWLVGFRKVTVMLLLIGIGVSFRLADLINGAEFVELLKVTGAAFFASNVGEHIVNVIKERMK
jgi:hypothetical protein|tara:strand:- start:360 stop:566 length:207 start_codon:yes stop_codon:yes gene_type:complete